MAAIEDILSVKTVKNNKGDEVAVESFSGQGKVVGLYFSAHWCPPCRNFTPVLVEFYKKMKESGKPLEIIFISSDKDEKSFNEYFATMPWLAIDFTSEEVKQKIKQKYEVRGIPTFILLDGESGETINKNARTNVTDDPEGTKFPWKA